MRGTWHLFSCLICIALWGSWSTPHSSLRWGRVNLSNFLDPPGWLPRALWSVWELWKWNPAFAEVHPTQSRHPWLPTHNTLEDGNVVGGWWPATQRWHLGIDEPTILRPQPQNRPLAFHSPAIRLLSEKPEEELNKDRHGFLSVVAFHTWPLLGGFERGSSTDITETQNWKKDLKGSSCPCTGHVDTAPSPWRAGNGCSASSSTF